MQNSRLLIPLVACALLAAGCGLKGPLYRADDQAQEIKRTDNAKKLPFPIKRTPSTMPPTQTPLPERGDGTPPPGATTPSTVDPDRPATPPPGT